MQLNHNITYETVDVVPIEKSRIIVDGCVCNATKKKCKNKIKYVIFCFDGEMRLSRFMFAACRDHLPLAIKKAWEENEKETKRIREKMKEV